MAWRRIAQMRGAPFVAAWLVSSVVFSGCSSCNDVGRSPLAWFSTQPSDGIAAEPIPPVQVTVDGGRSDVEVTIAIATGPAGASLSGTTTVRAVNNVATFRDLTFNKTGYYELVATATGFNRTTSSVFHIRQGPVDSVLFTTPPTDVQGGQSITPAVQVTLYDKGGNIATDATDPVTIGLNFGPPGAKLSDSTTVTPINGMATFSDLSIDKAGTYSLTASTPTARLPGVSPFFNVTFGLVSLVVVPENPTIGVGNTQPFKALATFSDGHQEDVTAQAVWTSSATVVATISNDGVASGIAPGQTGITARFSGREPSTNLKVTAGTLVSIDVSPATGLQ